MTTAYIQAFAALHEKGLYSSSGGFVPWQDDQSGPLDVLRTQVYDRPHTGFGKLNAPDKLAFSAAALMLRGVESYNPETTGICIGTVSGCFSTDMRYMESVAAGFPSPALFSATLPSSPVAEVAIMFKLKGPNRVFAGTLTPGLTALENALSLIRFHKAESMVVILVNGLDKADMQVPLLGSRQKNTFAFSFLLTPQRQTRECNVQFCLDLHKSNPNSFPSDSEESYFWDILTSLFERKNYSNSCTIDCTRYLLTLEKDD